MNRWSSRSRAALIAALWAGAALAPLQSIASSHPPDPQRLQWRINELEGEVAVLRQFAQQQDASIDQLQAQASAVQARVHRAWWASGLLAVVCAGMAWRLTRRIRQE